MLHEHIKFDALGFRNLNKPGYLFDGNHPRVFVLGGSTMVEGIDENDTVAGRLQSVLQAGRFSKAQVYNFGVVSACFAQMSVLVWSHLAALKPDALIVVGGGTDVTNPWTFDPRPGQPFNAFVVEQIYDYLFDTARISDREVGLSYDDLTSLLYARLEELRAECHWRTEQWEVAVVDATKQAMIQFDTLASTLRIPVICVLQPTIVRTKDALARSKDMASQDFLAYLDRQYARLQNILADLAGRDASSDHFYTLDLSALFNEDEGAIVYDLAHYTAKGRQVMADTLAMQLTKALVPPLRCPTWKSPIRRLRKIMRARSASTRPPTPSAPAN